MAELQHLKSTIPIAFTQVSEAVGSGFVASLARPGGNITGFHDYILRRSDPAFEDIRVSTPQTIRPDTDASSRA